MDALVRIMNILIGFNPCSICFRLLLAAVFGGCIGAERGRHGRPAGLRTHTLVSVGACISMMIGLYCVEKIGFNVDPLRIAAQVVSGIGFLGAGTIISDQNAHITGLTTAAGLWTTACIGLAIGLGFYLGAVMSFFIILLHPPLRSIVRRCGRLPWCTPCRSCRCPDRAFASEAGAYRHSRSTEASSRV